MPLQCITALKVNVTADELEWMCFCDLMLA